MRFSIAISSLLMSLSISSDSWIYYERSGPYGSQTLSFPSKESNSSINVNISCLSQDLRATISYEGYSWKEIDGSVILRIKGGWEDNESLHLFLRTKAAASFGFYLSDDDENKKIISLLGKGYPFDVIYEVNDELKRLSFTGDKENDDFTKLRNKCTSQTI